VEIIECKNLLFLVKAIKSSNLCASLLSRERNYQIEHDLRQNMNISELG